MLLLLLLILDARLFDNSTQMFQKLQWLPTDDIIGIKKLCMMFKIVNKECPVCFTSYRTYIKNTHSYNTRLSPNNALAVPKCRSNAGLRTSYARATCLWNRLDDKLKNILVLQGHFKVPFFIFYLDCTVLIR